MTHEEGRQRHRSTLERVEALERERRRDDEWQAHANQVILQHETRLDALDQNHGGVTPIVDAIDRLTAAMSRDSENTGHFSMHVTAVEIKEDSVSPVPVDTTPDLDLSATSVRAKISVVGPKASATGPYLTSAEVTWSKSNESEPGAIELEAAPDAFAVDEAGAPILDPAGLQIPIYSVYANTPLEPAEGSRASGVVTVSGPGMASRTKKVTYGNAPVGHFTMEGVEAPEV